MTDILQNSEQLSCESTKLLLEKRVADDFLSPEEEQLYNEHIDSCEKCRNLSLITFGLSQFANVPAAEDEFDGAILNVMEALESGRQKEHSRKIMWTGIGVAVAAVMILGIWSLLNINDISNASKPALQCTPSAAVELTEGVFMTTCDDAEPATIIEDGVVRISLNEGAVALSVNPKRPHKKQVSVITPDGEVRVKGTLFAVHVDNNDARVEVFRGIVEVIHKKNNNKNFDVKAGYGSKLKQKSPVKLKQYTNEILLKELPVSYEPSKADPKKNDLIEVLNEDKDSLKSGDQKIKISGSVLRKTKGAIKKTSPKAPMNDLIGDARSCLLVRDWKCAAENYEKILKLYSGQAQSSAVLISLAKVELRHLNNPQKALVHYKAYVKRAPGGPLAEEAFLGMADSYKRLGSSAKEAETLNMFVAKFPGSSLVGKAKLRLKGLK